MKRITIILVFSLAVIMQVFAQPSTHDPCNIMKDGDRYWVFYTSFGIGAISAGNPDFSDWQSEPSVFGGSWPSWINDQVPDFEGHFWAPACIYMNNAYYLYYSCSTFGSSLSAIGVVSTPSLNNPVWTDHGMVVSSNGSSTVNNAIDPALFKDDDGKVWMTYGSWFGGITMTEIDSLTGKAVGGLTQLAGGSHQDIEASYLMKHDGYYYLFVNRGNCCQGINSTYYIQVARSTSVKGPYSAWQTFLSTDERFIGPGHFGYNEGRMTYHFYDRDDEGIVKLLSTTLDWEDGWPVAGTVSQEPPGASIPDGSYRLLLSDTTKIVGLNNTIPAAGSNVLIWDYSSESDEGQIWNVSRISLNQYKISPESYSDLALEIYNCVPDDGANIGLWSYWGGSCQKWIFADKGDNLYQIRSVLSNKPFGVNGIPVNGTNILQKKNNDNDPNQLFKLKPLEQFPMVHSFTSQQAENPAVNILDGSREDDSRWSAETFPQSVVIDYTEIKKIIGTRVWTYQDRAYQYIIELDEDVSFANAYIVDRSSNTSAYQPIADDFDPVMARYARLTVTGASGYTGSWVSINEIEIVEDTTTTSQQLEFGTTDVALYPNPVSDILMIQIPDEFSLASNYTIYNSLGQIVFVEEDSYLNSVDVSSFEKGMYFIIITKGQKVLSGKFVKD